MYGLKYVSYLLIIFCNCWFFFERKILRRIYGPVNEGGRWRIRYNDELYQLFNEPEIVKEVKSRRVRWLGHLFRTEEQFPCRKLTFTRPYSTRKIG
jgi:hypothetical protein